MIAGAAAGSLIAAKVFLFPLVFWLLATRRWRAALASIAAAAVLIAGSWAAIGFRGLTEYPHLLRALSDARQGLGYSAAAVGMSAGASPDHARLIPIALLLVLLALTLWLGMSARADADCFAAAVAASVLGTPILWMHYAVVLLVPLAVRYRDNAAVWFGLPAFWLLASENPTPRERDLGLALLCVLSATLIVRRTRLRLGHAAPPGRSLPVHD